MKKEINISEIPRVEKKSDHFVIEAKELGKLNSLLEALRKHPKKRAKDAEALPKTTTIFENPNIVNDLIQYCKDHELEPLFERINLMLSDTVQGSPFYLFGKGLREIGEIDLVSSFLLAITNLFLLESPIPFDTYTFDSYASSHGKTIFIHRHDPYLISMIWEDSIKDEPNFSTFTLKQVKKILFDLVKALPVLR